MSTVPNKILSGRKGIDEAGNVLDNDLEVGSQGHRRVRDGSMKKVHLNSGAQRRSRKVDLRPLS